MPGPCDAEKSDADASYCDSLSSLEFAPELASDVCSGRAAKAAADKCGVGLSKIQARGTKSRGALSNCALPSALPVELVGREFPGAPEIEPGRGRDVDEQEEAAELADETCLCRRAGSPWPGLTKDRANSCAPIGCEPLIELDA